MRPADRPYILLGSVDFKVALPHINSVHEAQDGLNRVGKAGRLVESVITMSDKACTTTINDAFNIFDHVSPFNDRVPTMLIDLLPTAH